MFRKLLLCVAGVALQCSLSGCGSPNSQPAEQGLAQIRVERTLQRVSIDANNVSVQSILLELSRQAGFSLTISDGGELGRITVTVKNIPLEEGIQQVIGSAPYTLHHTVGENGLKTVAAVDVRRGASENNGAFRPSANTMAAIGTRTADFGWGSDRGRNGNAAGGTDHIAELAKALEDLSLDTLKQLMSEANDPALRLSMLDALTERDNQRSVRPIFLDALQDADTDVRGAALEHLQSSYDPIPLAPLADAVARETNSALRIETLTFLSDQALMDGRTKADLAVAMASVNRALTDPDPAVREQAQWSLEELSQAGAPTGFR